MSESQPDEAVSRWRCAAWPFRRRHCPGHGGPPHGAGCPGSSASPHSRHNSAKQLLQLSRTSCSMASGVVRRLVSHRVVRLVDRDKKAGVKGCGVTRAAGRDFHDPVGVDQGVSDVPRGLYRYAEACGYGAQRPGDVSAVATLVIPCPKRDLALAREMRSDLTMQRLLVALLLRRTLRLHGQEGIGPLLLELPQHRPLVVPGCGDPGLAVAVRLLRRSPSHPKPTHIACSRQ